MREARLSNTRRYITVPSRASVLMRPTVLEAEVWVLGDTAVALSGARAVVGVSSGLTAFCHYVGLEGGGRACAWGYGFEAGGLSLGLG